MFTVGANRIRARPEKKPVHFPGKEKSTISLDAILRGRSRNLPGNGMICSNISRKLLILRLNGGERGIRTPGTIAGTSDFESGALNRALPSLRIAAVADYSVDSTD